MAELDPAFEEYRRRWARLLEMGDRDAARAFMRGEAIDLAGDGQLDRKPGQAPLYLRVNGRGLDAVVDPGALGDMVEEWRAFLDTAPPSNPRQYAKQFIIKVVGSNRHLDTELGSLAMCAALWLMDSEDGLAALREGQSALLCDITLDHDTGDFRTQIAIIDDA